MFINNYNLVFTGHFLVVKYETIEEKLQRAKASGSTIKLSYKTIAFTGSAKAGKTSFLNLLYQKNFESVYHSTGVAESQQVICSQKLRLRPFVAGNSPKWISLSHQTMLRQLNRYLHVQLESGNEPFYPEQLVKKDDSAHEQSKCSVEDDILSAQYYFFSSETIAGDIWNIFNLLDTGGQPEYINLLPAVSRSISVTFIVLNMSGGEKSLDEPVLVAHSEDGMQSFEPYHLEITNLEFIKRLMASSNNSVIQIKQQEKNRLCQCCIGTHADQVDKKEIEKIEKRLSTLATELNCKSHLWSLNEKILFPVDNTTAGSKNEDPVAEQIRDHIQEVVESGNIHEVPITWFIFLLELQKVSSEQKVYYITYTSAVKICIQGQLCQSEDELQDALKCFHNMGMLHYYHDVPDMKQFIITDHQWFFEKLTILVKLSFKGQIINSEAITKFKKEGLLSKQLFFQIKIGTDIPTECFISLLEYLKIVAPVDTEHYFMPCVLPSYPSPSNDILTKYGKLQQIQLLVQFQQAPLPQGFFCCVAVEIFQSLPKNWLRPMQSTNDTHHTYNNLVTFHTSDTGHSVSLIDRIRYLEIQIRHKEASPAIHHDVKQFVSTTLVKVCNKLQLDSDILQYGFLCGCGQTSEGRHMTMLPQKFDFVPQWIHCKYDKTKITDDHLVWLQPCQVKRIHYFILYSLLYTLIDHTFEN